MTNLALLPANATPFEVEASKTWAALDLISPSQIETIWDAWACPAALLPWLGWSMSVDLWDNDWDEVRKRQAISDSPSYHRTKGTRRSVEDAVALLQRDTAITEWWEVVPLARKGTFRVFAALNVGDDSKTLRAKAVRLVRTAKPKSRYAYIDIGIQVVNPHEITSGVGTQTILTIAPYFSEMPDIGGSDNIGSGVRTSSILQFGPVAL